MITVQYIVDRLNFELDAEGSDRYIFDRDHKPAINAAQDWLVSLFNATFAENKLSEESLRELTYTKIWITSNRSRFAFDSATVGHSLWTILGIYPEITYTGSLAAQPTPSESVYCPSAIFLTNTEQAKRLTLEEWNEKDRNLFMPGNASLNWADYDQYSYKTFMNYDNSLTDALEIEIAPETDNTAIAMAYLKYPTAVTVIGGNVEFPETLTDLIVNKALQFISLKQGDEQGTLYKLTSSEIQTLVKLMT